MALRTLLALFLTATYALAGKPTDKFTVHLKSGRGLEFLCVQKGTLFVGQPTELAGEGGAGPARWYVSATQVKSTLGGYLAYDPTGKEHGLALVPEPGKNTEWVIDVPGKQKGDEGETAHLRVANGPLRGWYLAAEEAEQKKDGKVVKVWRPVLVKESKTKLVVKRIWN